MNFFEMIYHSGPDEFECDFYKNNSSKENPYGKSLLATLYWLFFFKQNGFKFWAKFLERFGTPILLGKVNSKDTTTTDMNNALLNAHAQCSALNDAKNEALG